MQDCFQMVKINRILSLSESVFHAVSADSFTDERSGVVYFLARVTIDAAELKKLDGRELYPGMGAEVMIKTGNRTTMDYILPRSQTACDALSGKISHKCGTATNGTPDKKD